MFSDSELQELLAMPKAIRDKRPARGYFRDGAQRRCDLELDAETDLHAGAFTVFVRQHLRFIENFSVGLRYRTEALDLGTITVVRYNGPHGDISRHPDGHYAKPHIHRLTSDELQRGSLYPMERHRETTDRYDTFERALRTFFLDAGVRNFGDFFPELVQLDMFNDN